MLQKSTFDFLRKLEKNNNREWFLANKTIYETAKRDFEETLQQVLDGLAKYDPDVKDTEAKKAVFRIYRDVRFSPNKTPYKNHFGAGFGKGGKKGVEAGYYVHLQPDNNSMIGGGIWMPPAPLLASIRQEIDYNTDEFKKILNHKDFKKYYGGMADYKLKTAPKNYPKDHPDIDLLKYTSFVGMHSLTDAEVLSSDFAKTAVAILKSLKPLLDFTNRVIE